MMPVFTELVVMTTFPEMDSGKKIPDPGILSGSDKDLVLETMFLEMDSGKRIPDPGILSGYVKDLVLETMFPEMDSGRRNTGSRNSLWIRVDRVDSSKARISLVGSLTV